MAHPHVLEAAVVAVPHPTWVERPLACVVPKPEHGSSLSGGGHSRLPAPARREVLAPGRGSVPGGSAKDKCRQVR